MSTHAASAACLRVLVRRRSHAAQQNALESARFACASTRSPAAALCFRPHRSVGSSAVAPAKLAPFARCSPSEACGSCSAEQLVSCVRKDLRREHQQARSSKHRLTTAFACFSDAQPRWRAAVAAPAHGGSAKLSRLSSVAPAAQQRAWHLAAVSVAEASPLGAQSPVPLVPCTVQISVKAPAEQQGGDSCHRRTAEGSAAACTRRERRCGQHSRSQATKAHAPTSLSPATRTSGRTAQ